MKRFKPVIAAVFFLGAAFSGPVIAQTTPADSLAEPRTLLNSQQVGIYIAPEFQYGQLGGDYTPIAGYSLMLLIDQRFAIGVSGGMSGAIGIDAIQAMQMNTGFGGLKMEYTFAPFRAVHLTVPVLVGVQMVRFNSNGSGAFFNDHNSMYGHGNGFAFVQPALMLEANLTRFAKIYLGASYHAALNAPDTYSVGSDTIKFGNSQASGAAFSAGVKLGWFNIQRPKFMRWHH